jgi:hypothetical protein
MFYHARYYAPALGRFISADTMVPSPSNPPGLNRYSYVYNNPLNLVDPSGHQVAPRCADSLCSSGTYGPYNTSMPAYTTSLSPVVQEQPLTTGVYYQQSEAAEVMSAQTRRADDGVLLEYYQPAYFRPKVAYGFEGEGTLPGVTAGASYKHETVYTLGGDVYEESYEPTVQAGLNLGLFESGVQLGSEYNLATGESRPYLGGEIGPIDAELQPGELTVGADWGGHVGEVGAEWRASGNYIYITSRGYFEQCGGISGFTDRHANGMILTSYPSYYLGNEDRSGVSYLRSDIFLSGSGYYLVLGPDGVHYIPPLQ